MCICVRVCCVCVGGCCVCVYQDQDQEILFQLLKTFSPKTTFQGIQNKNMIRTQIGMRGRVIDTKPE